MTGEHYVNQRLSIASNLCTVRYIGSVASTTGQWLGVEWDDPIRGKHQGVHKGVNYFDCLSRQPTAGSFVRPGRPTDNPRSFIEALQEKYASDYYEHKAALDAGIKDKDTTIWISGKQVEEVGFDKIRKQLADLKELRIVILDDLRIARPHARLEHTEEQKNDVWEACPKVYELDLSRNLFEQWNEVVDVCRQLPSLTSLKVSGNRFGSIECAVRTGKPFDTLNELTLDDTLLSWSEVSRIASQFTSLSSLAAAGNKFQSLTFQSLPGTLTVLNLERNDFQSLGALRSLVQLKNLQSLILKDNSISQTSSPNDAELLVFQTKLTNVDLSFNSISSWEFIDDLPHIFPGLTSLRTSHNPLYQGLRSAQGNLLTEDDGYMLTAARIGQLETLNFSAITRKERLNGETYYLSQIAYILSNSDPSSWSTVYKSHPRYADLCRSYGEPVIKIQSSETIRADSLAARLVALSISPGRSLVEPELQKQEFELEIPRDCTIQTTLGIISRRYALKPMSLKLVLEREDSTEDTLEPRTRPLRSWIDGNAAKLRVEISQVDIERSGAAKAQLQKKHFRSYR